MRAPLRRIIARWDKPEVDWDATTIYHFGRGEYQTTPKWVGTVQVQMLACLHIVDAQTVAQKRAARRRCYFCRLEGITS